jgi:hypothetical protein
MPSSQRSRLRLLLKLPFELREKVLKFLFYDSQIVIARDDLESSSKRKEIVSYPRSVTLLSICRELRRLRQQALQNFFQTTALTLMGTSPPRQLPELLPQGRLAKVRYLILDFPLERREVPELRICPKELPALETLRVYNLKSDANWFRHFRFYKTSHPKLWDISCSSTLDELPEPNNEYPSLYARESCWELLAPFVNIMPWLQEWYQKHKSFKPLHEDQQYPNIIGREYNIMSHMEFRLVDTHVTNDVGMGQVYGLINAVIDPVGQVVIKRECQHDPKKMDIETQEHNEKIRLSYRRRAEAEDDSGLPPRRKGVQQCLTHHVRGQRKTCPICGAKWQLLDPFYRTTGRFVELCGQMLEV